jgi:PAS domain S-box-containing protein
MSHTGKSAGGQRPSQSREGFAALAEQRTEQLSRANEELLREVAERRRVEQELLASRERHRQMIEDLPIGLFRRRPGLDGPFLLANAALVEMFGCPSREEFLRMGMADLWEDEGDWREFHQKLTARGKVCADDVRMKKHDGTPLWAAVTAVAVGDGYGQVQHINGLIRDITKQRLLQEQLAQAQKLEAMGQLAAGIAHEINTPTQFVGDNMRFVEEGLETVFSLLDRYRELLARADPTDEMQAELRAAEQQADLAYLREDLPAAARQSLEGVGRVVEIVRAMKDFSHPDRVEKVPTDLNKTIESTVTLARNEWKYVAEMEMDFDPDLPAVPVLPGDFKQVVLNLLINAAHAIGDALGERGEQKGTIRVSTRRDGDWAEVRVADTGTGIPPQIRQKVFDLFFTTKEAGKGTGQGLAISRAVIVEKHGGTISFETEMGRGTTFIVRVPVRPAATEEGSGNE